MARKTSTRPEVAAQTPYLEGVAKNLADKLYGPGGAAAGDQVRRSGGTRGPVGPRDFARIDESGVGASGDQPERGSTPV